MKNVIFHQPHEDIYDIVLADDDKWLLQKEELMKTLDYMPNCTNLTIGGSFLLIDRGLRFLESMLSSKIRSLELVFRIDDIDYDKVHDCLSIITRRSPAIRHLQLKFENTESESSLGRYPGNWALDHITILERLQNLCSLLIPREWKSDATLRRLSSFPSLIWLNFMETSYGSYDLIASGIVQNSEGPFRTLQMLSLSCASHGSTTYDELSHFPDKHPLKMLYFFGGLPPELSQRVVQRFPDLECLDIYGLLREGIIEGVSPLAACSKLVSLSIRTAILSSDHLSSVLGSWPNLKKLLLLGPSIEYMVNSPTFNHNNDLMEFASQEPFGLSMDVLEAIAAKQPGLVELTLSVACYSTGYLKKAQTRLPDTLTMLHLKSSFFNFNYRGFDEWAAAEYLASILPIHLLDFYIEGEMQRHLDDDDEDEDDGDEAMESFRLKHSYLCEKVESIIMKKRYAVLTDLLQAATG